MKKDQYWKVLDAVLSLEMSKGHQRWTISQVARISGVKRPLIYYYFGKSKPEIIRAAIKIIGDEFFGLSEERLEMWRQGHIKESVLKTRELIQRAPHVRVFYFLWRQKKSDIQTELIEIERKFLSKIKSLRPNLPPRKLAASMAIFYGLVNVQELKVETLDDILGQLF